MFLTGHPSVGSCCPSACWFFRVFHLCCPRGWLNVSSSWIRHVWTEDSGMKYLLSMVAKFVQVHLQVLRLLRDEVLNFGVLFVMKRLELLGQGVLVRRSCCLEISSRVSSYACIWRLMVSCVLMSISCMTSSILDWIWSSHSDAASRILFDW